MELRDIKIFLTPAEELHFDRTSRVTRLTPIGERLRTTSRPGTA